MIGNVEADNTITDEKLLTDYLSALPTEMQTAVYRDKEFDTVRSTANSAAAAVVLANTPRTSRSASTPRHARHIQRSPTRAARRRAHAFTP